jgi:hypothetical protein
MTLFNISVDFWLQIYDSDSTVATDRKPYARLCKRVSYAFLDGEQPV